MVFQLITQFLFIGASVASVLPRASTVQWGKCDDGLQASPPAQCGNISVPLDYTSANASATYTLPLLRIPVAANITSRGSIIINFGGPGQPGIPLLAAQAQAIRSSLSPDYDLISFNPRGTNKDELFFSCYTEEERTRVFNPDPLAEMWYDESDVAPGMIWAESKLRADQCFKSRGDVGGLVGTVFVVRDIVKISEAVGDELVNYFGISYGTVLGATLVSMFPNKVGKVVLDSVGNPHGYIHDMNELGSRARTDATFDALLSQCVAQGPIECPLARHASTAAELQAKIYAMIDAARANPIALPLEHARYDTTIVRGTVVDYSTLKTMAFLSLFAAGTQTQMLAGLDGALREDWATYAAWRDALDGAFASQLDSEVCLGISCGDSTPRSDDPELVPDGMEAASRISRIAGGAGPSNGLGFRSSICAQWRVAAKERYLGDYNVSTKNPVLIVNNRYDPATPLELARNVSAGLAGSRVVEVNKIGHGAVVAASKCLQDVIADFFGRGIMLEVTLCELDEPLLQTDGTLGGL
ncbi:unnamed protein product [Clonostachys rhizophaga]|uniref:Peptidase S33 tripeptidyl aminopeptidase-like C-terminal domain-containing protein n=1 Tax=Clonostachys rhizophaga TaxID=160324 RepID=A0A9N9VQT0_9HYPO|nr:unnamed protein product [Clonostachys rhizophaga]